MITPSVTVDAIIQKANSLRITMSPDGAGGIRCKSPTDLPPSLKQLIVDNKSALLERLSTWNATEANRLMFTADSVVEQCGACGLDPEIAKAAGECVAAHGFRDLARIRAICQRIEDRARSLFNAEQRPIKAA